MYSVNRNDSIVTHIVMSITLGIKSLMYSKKWFIYIILSLAPFLFSIASSDRLGGNFNGLQAFISYTMDNQFGFFYVFGVLLLALPVSSDEITDHVMDLFLIRPVYKEVLFFTRYFVLVLANTVINSFLVIFCYVYYYTVDNRDMFNREDLNVLFGVLIFYVFANLLYSALFLSIGFIGQRGFGIGVFVAIVELFFLNFLFLSDSALVPRTNLKIIAHQILGDNFIDTSTSNFIPSLSSYLNALLYVFGVTIALLVIGLLYFRNRDFS